MNTAATIKYKPIRFGTDGWRAVIGDGFTFANVEIVAQAYADYLSSNTSPKFEGNSTSSDLPLVIIGYDRRFLSEQFAQRTAEVFRANNFKVALFFEDVPTPLVSWAVKDNNAVGGVVITASHNPAIFNGFKIKAPWGGSASPKITTAVESFVNRKSPQVANFSANDNAELVHSSIETYNRQIADFIDLELIKSAKTKVVIDSMHGSGGLWTESFIRGGALEIETIRAERNTLFGGINPEPIDQNLEVLKTRVRETNAVLGLATDGDADRLGAVNELGETMTMQQVVPILLLYLIRKKGLSGGIVRTFSQSVLLKRIAAAYNLPIYETPIGFKYIADLMLEKDILIGAEESGGIGLKGHIPERDGILNSLLLLEAVIAFGKTPSEIVREIHQEFGEFHFGRRDLGLDIEYGQNFIETIALNPPTHVANEKIVGIETLDGTKLVFGDESWLLFRQSGTEPMFRVYAEATSVIKAQSLLDAGVSLVNYNVFKVPKVLIL